MRLSDSEDRQKEVSGRCREIPKPSQLGLSFVGTRRFSNYQDDLSLLLLVLQVLNYNINDVCIY